MDQNNTVRVVVNGSKSEYSYWTDISITSEINTLARSFQIGTTANLPDAKTMLTQFKHGDLVQVYIGQDLVVTGYIDALPVSYTATSVDASISGRSRTEDLIDCSPAERGHDFSSVLNSKDWSALKGPGTFIEPETTLAAQQFINLPLKQAVAQLIAPYGIHLICELDNEVTNKKVNLTVKGDDTILKALQTLVGTTGLYFIDDEYGNLKIIDETKRETVPVALSLGDNIINAQAAFDGSDLYSDYWLNSSQNGDNTKTGSAVQNIIKSSDSEVKRFRLMRSSNSKMTDAETSGERKEAQYRRAQFYKTSYTVAGWRQNVNEGALWEPNTLVTINDDLLNNSQTMLITKVTFTLDNSGMITVLDCVPPAGFKRDAVTATTTKASVSKAGKNSASWSDIDLVGPEK